MEAGYSGNRKITLVIISIILHCLILLFILCDVQMPFRQFLLPDKQVEKKDWATRNPGKSNFGAPVIFKTPSRPAQTQKQQTTKPQQDKRTQRPVKTKRLVAQKQKQVQTKKDEALKQVIQKRDQQRTKELKHTQLSKKEVKQLPTQLTMAHLLQGFLEQRGTGSDSGLRHKGTNKQAPDEQIKYERYAQKIHWCIQNTFRINKHKLVLPHAVRCIMRLYIDFQDNGLVKEVKLLQPSGSPHLDQFMIELVKDAGKSFPPFPKFLDKNLLPKVYTLQVDAPATRGSNLTMSM